jgi:hypothetical protein
MDPSSHLASGSSDKPEREPKQSNKKSAPDPPAEPSDEKRIPRQSLTEEENRMYPPTQEYLDELDRLDRDRGFGRAGPRGATLIYNALYPPEIDFWSKDLDNQYFKGPQGGRGAYASVCVLDPILTIEHRDQEYHIAVNFHLETTILGYSTQKRFAPFPFISTVCSIDEI